MESHLIFMQYFYMHLKNLSIILFAAYWFFNTKHGNDLWEKDSISWEKNRKKWWKLVLLFSLFTLYATFMVGGDGSSFRMLGIFLGGFIGGVRFGLTVSLAGVLGLIVDEFYVIASPTSEVVGHLFLSSVVVTVLAGLFAGIFHRFYENSYASILRGMCFVLFLR